MSFRHMRVADQVRTVIWILVVVFFIIGLVFAYIGIITQDGDVAGGLAGLNLGLALLLAFGNGMSYL